MNEKDIDEKIKFMKAKMYNYNYSTATENTVPWLPYTSDSESGRNINAYLIEKTGEAKPVTLTDVEGYAESPTGIYHNGEYTMSFVRKDVEIKIEDLKEDSDLCVMSFTPKSMLKLQNVAYNQEEMMPGNKVTIKADIFNNGLEKSDDYRVQVVDGSTVIGETIVTDKVNSGDTSEVEVNAELPKSMKAKKTFEVS